ncbi:MAG: hypothetical protein P8Y68_12495 [Anaerolineales bacterium]|jgi:hypothetical protein
MENKNKPNLQQRQRTRNVRRFFERLKKSLSKGWRSFTRFIKNIYLALLLVAGVAIVIGSIFLAQTFVEKSTAILVASIGSVLGTVVFAFTLPSVIGSKVKEGVQQFEDQIEENLQLAQEVKDLRQAEEDHLDEIISLEKEKAVLQRELEKQKNMHIEIDNIRPIEKVSFIEVNSMITDVLLKEIENNPPESIRKGSVQEYLGILDTRFKANLGVDMKKVGLRIDELGKVVISGISSEFQGFYIEKEDWKLYEIREKKWGGLLNPGESKKILNRDERLAELTIEQRSSLMDRLSMGVDFSYLDESIRKITMEYLGVLLSPLHREITFVDRDDQPTLQLADFLEVHNTQVEKQMAYLNSKLAEVEQKLLDEGEGERI